jgi:hypothetical protein
MLMAALNPAVQVLPANQASLQVPGVSVASLTAGPVVLL